MNIKLRERQRCDNDNMMKSIRRTGIVTVNRNCLSQTQHTALLSTPRGHAWTRSHDLNFIIEKCRKTVKPTLNDRRRETKQHAFLDVNTTMWPLFVKQFLQHAEYSLAPTTRIILTKILPSRVNFSDLKWSSHRNTQIELCRFLRNLNPECDSVNWKEDFFRTLSFLIFNYMVQVICSGRILKKQKITQVILKKINDVINKYVLLSSSYNFLQEIQIFIAHMLSPWLEKPINDICSKGTNNKELKDRNTMNNIVNHRIEMKTKHSKYNKLEQNKTNRLKLKTTKKVETNQKSKKGQFKKFNKINNKKKHLNTDYTNQTVIKKKITNKIENQIINTDTRRLKNNQNKTNRLKLKSTKIIETIQKTKKGQFKKSVVKDSLSSLNSNKAANEIKTNRIPKKSLKSKSAIDIVKNSKKVIENDEMLSNSVLVRHPTNKNIIKKKIKNIMVKNSESENNHKPKKSKISKTFIKGKLSLQNFNKARKKVKSNQKSKKGLKSKSIIGAMKDSEKVIENNELLSNSILLKHSVSQNASETKIKSKTNSIILENKNHSNINDHDKYINGKKSNYIPVAENENTIEADSNDNKENHFIINDAVSVRPAIDTENTNAIIDTNHNGRNDDDQRNTEVDNRFKSHYEDGGRLLTEYSGELTAAISNGITDSYYQNANEDDKMLNVMDYSGHTTMTKYLSGEIHNTNLLKGEELLKYNDKNSHEIHDNGNSDINTDYDIGFNDDEEHHIIIMNEDGEEFESRVLDDLANVFLDSSSAGWSNKLENTTQVMESRGNKSNQICFQRCADCYVRI